jgi:hypothetical protein
LKKRKNNFNITDKRITLFKTGHDAGMLARPLAKDANRYFAQGYISARRGESIADGLRGLRSRMHLSRRRGADGDES